MLSLGESSFVLLELQLEVNSPEALGPRGLCTDILEGYDDSKMSMSMPGVKNDLFYFKSSSRECEWW